MTGFGLAQLLELRRARVLVTDEAFGELAGLDVGQDRLHVLLHVVVDDPRARDIVAVLGGVRDGPALLRDAALDHQVDDHLELVQALEVGHLRLVAGLGQGLETSLHQVRHAAAQDDLLAEQVSLGLLGEGGLDAAGPQATDRLRVALGQLPGLAAGVLLDANQHRDTASVGVLATHYMAWALRGDHADVHTLGRGDVAVTNVEAVREEDGVASLEVGGDLVRVDMTLHLVGHQNHDHVGLCGGLRRGEHPQTFRLGLGTRPAALGEADSHVDARITQVQRVGVALGTVTDHGDAAVLDDCQVRIVVIEHLCHGVVLLLGLAFSWLPAGQHGSSR